MADIVSQLGVKLTDGSNTAAITAGSALRVDNSAVTQPVSGTIAVSGTVPVSGTVTNVPSGTQTISGTVVTNADANIAAGTAPSKALVGGLVYNTSTPTLTNGQTIAIQGDVSGNLKVVLTGTSTVTSVPSGTQTVAGTVTNVPSGTQTVAGTITTNADANVAPGTAPAKVLVGGLVYNSAAPTATNGQTLALQGDASGNLKVAGTFTSVPSGTQAVSGTVTSVQSGTYTVAGTVTNVPSGTQTVSGTVTTVPSGTQDVAFGETTTGIVAYYGTATTVANASTGTISYTVTTAKTLYLKGIFASSSGAPCKVTIDYGAGPTIICVGFYNTSTPFLAVDFPQPISISATTVVNVKIQNNAGAAQDVYASIFGHEI